MELIVVRLCILDARMPRKFRLYHSKNSERKRRQKSSSDQGQGSGSGPSNESNTVSELPGPTNDSYSDCVASSCLNESSEQQSHDSAIISPSPGTDQSVAEGALHALRSSVLLPDGWSDHSPSNLKHILLCRISNQASSSMVPLQMTHCLKIEKERSWSLFVRQNRVDTTKSRALKLFPSNSHYVKMVLAKKGKVISKWEGCSM